MPSRYRILSPVEWDEGRLEIDEVVEMPDAIARQLLEVGAIKPAGSRKSRAGEGGGDNPRRDPAAVAGAAEGKPATAGDDPPSPPAGGGGEPHANTPPRPEDAGETLKAPPGSHDAAGDESEAHGAGAPAPPPAGVAGAVSRHNAIVAAAGRLDPGDPSLWVGRGKSRKPKVAALGEALGFDITGAERDAAWAVARTGD